jgi:hypothetical protein
MNQIYRKGVDDMYKPTPIEELQPELLCINAEKVYDWVILQATENQTIPATGFDPLAIDPCAATVTNLVTTCFLVDPLTGDPLPPNAEIEVEELGQREDRTFNIDGETITLQRVSFTKPLSVVVQFSGIDGTTPFIVQTSPILFEIPESIFLCAPIGTRLVVRLTDVECSASPNCVNNVLQSIDINLNICQSVQSVADVTLELTADFCEPRDILVEQCPTPSIPPQCPVLFPGNQIDD